MAAILCRIALAAVLSVAVTAAATAREFTVVAQGRLLIMEIAGHIVSVPGPLWTEPGETVDVQQSQVVYQQLGPGVESVLFLPLDETIVTWTRMMGVLAVNRPCYTASQHLASIVTPMRRSCAPSQMMVAPITAADKPEGEALLLMCGRYLPTRKGPRNCAGGIVLAFVLQSEKGAMKAFNEWCTSAFDVAQKSDWPVPEQELNTLAAELLQATRFRPVDELAEQAGQPQEAPQ